MVEMLIHRQQVARSHSGRSFFNIPMELQMVFCLAMLVLVPSAAAATTSASGLLGDSSTNKEIQCPCGMIEVLTDGRDVLNMTRTVCENQNGTNMDSTSSYSLTSPEYCYYSIIFKPRNGQNECKLTNKAINTSNSSNADFFKLMYNNFDLEGRFLYISKHTNFQGKNNFVRFNPSLPLLIYLRCTKENCWKLFSEGIKAFTHNTFYSELAIDVEEDSEDEEKELWDFFLRKVKKLEDLHVINPPRTLESDPSFSAKVVELMKPYRTPIYESTIPYTKPFQRENVSFTTEASVFVATETSSSSTYFWCHVLALLWHYLF